MMEFYAPQFVLVAQALAMARVSTTSVSVQKSIRSNEPSKAQFSGLGRLFGRPEITALEDELAEAKRLAAEAEEALLKSAQANKDGTQEIVRVSLKSMLPLLSQMGMEFSLKEAERLSNQEDARDISPDEIEQFLSRIRDEISTHFFFQLNPLHRKYYKPKEPVFGPDFEVQFPSASFELDEAIKCLAFDRSTAAVFHCMRIMEIGIKATARCLGIPDPVKPADRNWGMILKSFKTELERRTGLPIPNRLTNPDRAFFEEIYASLDAVRNPWRNATMHVENKYTADEAEHIFVAVRGFMKKLSSRLNETGEPKCP